MARRAEDLGPLAADPAWKPLAARCADEFGPTISPTSSAPCNGTSLGIGCGPRRGGRPRPMRRPSTVPWGTPSISKDGLTTRQCSFKRPWKSIRKMPTPRITCHHSLSPQPVRGGPAPLPEGRGTQARLCRCPPQFGLNPARTREPRRGRGPLPEGRGTQARLRRSPLQPRAGFAAAREGRRGDRSLPEGPGKPARPRRGPQRTSASRWRPLERSTRLSFSIRRPWRPNPTSPKPTTIWPAFWRPADKPTRPLPITERHWRSSPTSSRPTTTWAACWLDRGEIDEAAAQYRKALAIKPDTSRATITSVLLLPSGQGKSQALHRAVAQYQKALEAAPRVRGRGATAWPGCWRPVRRQRSETAPKRSNWPGGR